jgi:hypothetical protein
MAATTILDATTWSQNASTSGYYGADDDVAEAAQAENATMAGTTNQTTSNGNVTDVQFLAIQNAQSGSLSQINLTAYTLELRNVSDSTVLFSERPERIVTPNTQWRK